MKYKKLTPTITRFSLYFGYHRILFSPIILENPIIQLYFGKKALREKLFSDQNFPEVEMLPTNRPTQLFEVKMTGTRQFCPTRLSSKIIQDQNNYCNFFFNKQPNINKLLSISNVFFQNFE